MATREKNNPELDLLSHFEELRTRILYGILAIVIGVVVGWFIYPTAYQMMSGPIIESVRSHGGEVITLQPAEAFFTRVKLAGALGLILASPLVLWQLWLFVRPGLTPRERRVVGPLAPAICVLFLAGAALAYLFLPRVMTFFLAYVPAGVSPNITFQESIDLPLKVILGFGLAFQLPIVLIALVWLRILSPAVLLRHWRVAVVVMAILAAVLTPTGDPLNWSLMMVPLMVLYFGTTAFAYTLVRKDKE